MGIFSNDAAKVAKRTERRELERQARIDAGMEHIENVFSGNFNPSYYEGVRGAATEYATQDVQDQYQDAQRNLIFALARSGTNISSEAARRQGKLGSDQTKALYDADSLGVQAEKQARADTEREKTNLITQLQATADPAAAASAARTSSEFLSMNRPMDTLGPLFQNVTAGLAGSMRPTYDAYGQPIRSGGGFTRGGASRDRGRVIGG